MVCLLALLIVISIFPITAFAEEIINQNEGMVIDKTSKTNESNSDSFTFVISNTVIGISEAEYSTEFAFTGKIQTGIKRNAVEGDYWYGTSDVVYEGLQIYTNSIEYKRINTDSGSVIDTGIITPNSYGLFFFNLKHNETIEFSVDNMGNMGFYLFETPNEQYETKAVWNENEYEGTTNVLTGEVIGVGAVPGDMETRYYETNVTNIGTEYAPKLQPLTGDVNVNYINTAKTMAQKYCVSYSFVSKTPGKEVPQEVLNLLPVDQRDIPDGTEIIPTAPAQTEVSVPDGKWVFEGYNISSATISGANIALEGYWTFVSDTEAKTYQVTYSFVSKTPGKEIPQEVLNLLPADQRDVPDGTEIIPTAPVQTEVSVTDGKWVFDGYNITSATISGANIAFEGYWTFVSDTEAKTYQVTYSFVSKTPGKEIPQEVLNLLPADQRDVPDGTEIIPTALAKTEVSVTGGKWVFDGYTFNTISINGSDIVFIGCWSFYKEGKKPINNDNSDESSPHPESHDSSNGNVQEETSTISDSPENDIIPDNAEISENEISAIIPLDSENHLRLGWITMLLMMCVLQCALSVSIASDMHVLRWYAQKKKANEVIV